ncbi:Predicted nucleic acid-binding protein, contains PIN domain [Halorientalis persicus]|uniref:Predicted nucleic acid-binding protein, contains PIN domain n=1 Tax=Halorientalis persicus TaxID=1367881 RepID=A0A1H8NRA6_9EURY|nr:hypothetical protein [Halorientalis persicus]SEO32151.1 Predicted nucleic acid-binding protein, contains PIN domain [Halorientalis persicus]
MSEVDTPRHTHFQPYNGNYTTSLVIGPKFLVSVFRTNHSNDEESRKGRFAEKLLTLIRDEELPFRQLLVTHHTLDEAATRLKKKAQPSDAFDCVTTVRESKVYCLTDLDVDTFDSACTDFTKYGDHGGAMTDFINKAFVEVQTTDYIATWDDHYEAFDELELLPHCDH